MHPLYTNLQVNTLPIHFLCRKKIFNLYNNIIMKNLFYALTFFSFVTACSDNSVQNPTPPPVSDNGDNNNMQVVEFLRNRAMVADVKERLCLQNNSLPDCSSRNK